MYSDYFSKETTQSRIFAGIYDDTEVHNIRTNVKLNMCLKLSASPPKTDQRTGGLRQALDSLCTCLHEVFEERGPMTEDQRDFTSLMRDRLSGVVDLPNFPTCCLKFLPTFSSLAFL